MMTNTAYVQKHVQVNTMVKLTISFIRKYNTKFVGMYSAPWARKARFIYVVNNTYTPFCILMMYFCPCCNHATASFTISSIISFAGFRSLIAPQDFDISSGVACFLNSSVALSPSFSSS